MTRKYLQDTLLDELDGLLDARGYRRREQTFLRSIPIGKAAVHVSFAPHTTGVNVASDVAIRFDAVEDARNQFRAQLSAREKRGTFTVGAQIANIAGVGVLAHSLVAPEQARAVAAEIHATIERWGEPFLERYSAPHTLLEVLNEDGPEATLVCPFAETRAAIRVALTEWLAPRTAG